MRVFYEYATIELRVARVFYEKDASSASQLRAKYEFRRPMCCQSDLRVSYVNKELTTIEVRVTYEWV